MEHGIKGRSEGRWSLNYRHYRNMTGGESEHGERAGRADAGKPGSQDCSLGSPEKEQQQCLLLEIDD